MAARPFTMVRAFPPSVEAIEHDAPSGRFVQLPARGRTFVRDMPGPPGAPTVVLLHGWASTADLNWSPSYASLAREFRVVALDQRGHGLGLRGQGPFRLEQCADDVAALAAHLGIARFIPVGYSMGGAVAQLLWHRHRELVDGLVLCASSRTFIRSRTDRLAVDVLASATAVARATRAHGLTRMLAGVRASRPAATGRGGSALNHLFGHDWTQIIEAGLAIGRFDSHNWISKVAIPTAVVVNLADHVVPTHRQLELAQAIPGASMHPVAGGHCVCASAPRLFVPALIQACRAVVARRGLIASEERDEHIGERVPPPRRLGEAA